MRFAKKIVLASDFRRRKLPLSAIFLVRQIGLIWTPFCGGLEPFSDFRIYSEVVEGLFYERRISVAVTAKASQETRSTPTIL